jgi:hypothetical protein
MPALATHNFNKLRAFLVVGNRLKTSSERLFSFRISSRIATADSVYGSFSILPEVD